MNIIFLVIPGLILLGYLFGSIPTGYLIAKYLKGIDIREYGSGSTGATNILRNVGKIPALSVLLIDLGKGMIAIAIWEWLFKLKFSETIPSHWQPWLIVLTGLAAIIGHSKPVWLNFKGGKSVATSLGVLFMANPLVASGTLAVFLIVLGVSRIVSLSSIAGAIAVGLLMVLLHQPLPYILLGISSGVYVIWRHQSNIERLGKGTEPRIGQTVPSNQS
jgi:glycerol-3-phosphate acyltransferase PlsY